MGNYGADCRRSKQTIVNMEKFVLKHVSAMEMYVKSKTYPCTSFDFIWVILIFSTTFEVLKLFDRV